MNAPQTREKYTTRLKRFFDFIDLPDDNTGTTTSIEERCKYFVEKSKNDQKWLLNNVLKFLLVQKERIERKEITGATVRNYVKTIKLFCEMSDLLLPWKKITRGLPKGRKYADDRAPTIEEIRRIIEYPDRRIKAIVYTMTSGIRLGAWDYLQWGHIKPVRMNNQIIAAKIIVYAGEEGDEYFSFITPEAYYELEKWMRYRKDCGEIIDEKSWVMRNIWNTKQGCNRGLVSDPRKLKSSGIKRLMEDSLWTQGLRKKLEPGKRRHEFQTDHGFRKWYKTQCEMAGMKPINIEKLMGHSVGISDSYYRATENELLEDYLKAAGLLTINSEYKLQKQMEEVIEQSKNNDVSVKSQLYDKEHAITNLTERNSLNVDAIASLADQVMKLMEEIEILKRNQK
jgi:integrase